MPLTIEKERCRAKAKAKAKVKAIRTSFFGLDVIFGVWLSLSIFLVILAFFFFPSLANGS
jgi:hypothetical protein